MVGKYIFVLKINSCQAGPRKAILVIFGRRALIFFESSWKNMKNDTTLVRMPNGDHLGDAKMSKDGPSNLTFLLIAIDRTGFRRIKKKGRATKQPSVFFLPRDLVLVLQNLVIYLPHSFYLKDHN